MRQKKITFEPGMNRFVRTSGILLLSLYAFFFASTNLFVHTHEGPYYKIVHSHPWSGKAHSHTSDEVQSISILSVQTCLVGENGCVPEGMVTYGSCVATSLPEADVVRAFANCSGLRAPPCL